VLQTSFDIGTMFVASFLITQLLCEHHFSRVYKLG